VKQLQESGTSSI